MSLEEMRIKGILESCKASDTDITRLLKMAERCLIDSRVDAISNETRFIQAYEVIFTCSLIALFRSGYRIRKSSGKHFYTIDSLKFTLEKDIDTVNYFQQLRKKRHQDIYEGALNVSDSELAEAIEIAERLLDEIRMSF